MSKALKFRALGALICAAAVLGAYQHTIEDAMTDAASHYLAALTADQVKEGRFDFDSKYRETWHFVPGNSYEQTYGFPRPGLTYKKMQPEQRHLADALMSAGLSPTGYIKAKSVMSLEEILRIAENDTAGRRDPLGYHFSIFGTPSKSGKWGWSVEGHHLSLNYTLQNGKLVSSSPTFYGANPHEVRTDPRRGLRVLSREDDLGRELIKALDANQRKTAIVDETAYRDILTAADTRAKLEDQPPGLAASKMNAKQYALLLDLVTEYARNLPGEVAEKRIERARKTAKDKLLFAWAGSVEPGKGDYYRIQSPDFLIEYDNTQNQNNHSHTVWRDFENDFGRDVLALHHRLYDHGLGVAAD